jgi:predicted RecA/RadA family phage recombinase|tara:strand:- start:1381 stop:1866 length:486 start_codon:yes stop_codon:yes gene_type:complete
MAQTGFMLSDEGRTLTVLNDSGTTAVEAGDIVYSAANNDAFTGTAASARNAYAVGDIKVKSMTDSATGYQTVLGVALQDIPADGYGSIAMEGVFIHAVDNDTEAGDFVRGDDAASNKLKKFTVATTTVTKAVFDERSQYKCGKALTGGSADGKFVAWKLSL